MSLLRLASHPTGGDEFLYDISTELPQAYAQRVSKTPHGVSLYRVHLDYAHGYSNDLPGLFRLLGGTLLEYSPPQLGESVSAHAAVEAIHTGTPVANDAEKPSSEDKALGIGDAARLEEDLRALQENAVHFKHDHAVGICELDGFDSYSHVHGQAVADAALDTIAQVIAAQCRLGDSAYHLGGGVFVLIFPGETASTAALGLERVRKAIESLGLASARSNMGTLTVSAGVSTVQPEARQSVLSQAEDALHQAESAGGNQVRIYDGPPI